MKSWYAKSIRNKITSVVLVAVVPALLLVSVVSAVREADHQRTAFDGEHSGIAAALGSAVSEPLASGDTRQVANALKGIAAIPNITHVDVQDATGRIVFQFGAGIIVTSGVSAAGTLPVSLKTRPFETDIKHAGAVIGKLRLIADASQIRDSLMRSIAAALLTALLAVGLGLTASSRMQRSVSQPLLALRQAMTQIAKTKDFSHSVPRTSLDETAHLVDAFNGMMHEIRERDGALAGYRDSLEIKVEQRTQELAHAVDQAQAANRAKSEFLATMSHEIRTPMNGMLVMAELLAASEMTPRAQRHCEVILRSGQTLLAIINDILDLSKIEAGKLTLERVPCDLHQIADDVLKLFSERAASKGLQLASYIAPDVPAQIYADPVRLSQIIANLVNNAIKFTQNGGVTIVMERGQDRATRISVLDTGIGIQSDKLSTIFDPFTQAEQSTTRRFGGTGIGLTICRKLADAMGGTLTAQSTLGAGSTFAFEASFDSTRSPSQVEELLRGTGLIVTALEEGPVLSVVCRLAADHGFDVVKFGDAYEASAVRAVICAPQAWSAIEHAKGLDDKLRIVLTRLGQSAGEETGRGGAMIPLEVPFAPRELHAILNAMISGHAVSQHSSAPQSSSATPLFAGVRALAADDSAINREVLMEALSRLGVSVTCVEDGAQAVEAAKTGSFDVVFMDGSMPGMDGFEATREIRRWENSQTRPPLPIVGLSAHVIGEHAEAWRACGMSDFITKPFTLAAIRGCLARWITAAPAAAASNDQQVAAEDAGHAGTLDQLLDLDVLQSVREMQPPGTDLVGRIVRLYADHAPNLLANIMQPPAMEPGELAPAAHALKSISRNVGALRVGNLCGALEDAAREGRCERELYRAKLAEALDQTLAALSKAVEPEAVQSELETRTRVPIHAGG